MINMIATGIYMFLVLIIVTVIIAAYINYRKTKQNPMFIFLCVCVIFWLVTDLAILYVNIVSVNVFIWNLGAIFVSFSALGIFLVAFQFFLPDRKLPKYAVFLLGFIPSLTVLVAITSYFHSFIRNVYNINIWPRNVEYASGSWLTVQAVFSFLLLIFGIFIVVHGSVKKINSSRFSSIAIVVAISALPFCKLLYITGFTPLGKDHSSIGAAIAVILMHFALSDNKYGKIFSLFNTLKSRITFPILMAVFLMMVFIIFYIARTTRILIENTDEDRMTATVYSAQVYLDTYRQKTRAAAAMIGSSSELIHFIDDGNRLALWQYINNKKEIFGVDAIIISDHQGRIIARSYMRDFYDGYIGSASVEPAIEAALNGDFITIYTSTQSVPMVMSSTFPIFDGDRLAGGIAVNFNIGTNDFLDRLSGIFNMDATVFDGNVSVASSIINPDTNSRAINTTAHQDITTAVLGRGEHVATHINLFGIPYFAYYFPLRGVSGNPDGMFFIGFSQVEGIAATGEQLRNIILISKLGLIVVSIIMFLLIRNSLKPLGDLAKKITDVAGGNIDVSTDRSKITTDEIGMLTHDILNLADVIKSIVEELSVVNEIYNIQGDSTYRINEEKYQSTFREMVENVNGSIENEFSNIKYTVKLLDQISDGDFDIQLNDLSGDWNIQTVAFRNLVANLKDVSTQVNDMIEASIKGDLNFKIDADNYKGGWREIMIGLNQVAKSVDRPISEIRDSMAALNAGKFDTLVTGDYAGDFLAIKKDVNEMITNMSAYVNEIGNSLSNVAKGDLTYHIDMDFQGDFNKIKTSITHIADTLNRTMTEISSASNQVLSSAKQISVNAANLAGGAQEQAGSVEELNVALEMISQQTKQNAASAETANDLSNISSGNAKEGNESMKHMVSAMTQIRESSNSISSVIKVIQDIAFQTNLLALNASIEASRAGEHGKGFSVVAEEVRGLASNSQSAANETTELIENSLNKVESGSVIAESTSQSLSTIVNNAGDLLKIINSISIASKEQMDKISNVSEGLSQISQVVQNNSAVSEETAAASEELNSQAEVLQRLVSYFKLK